MRSPLPHPKRPTPTIGRGRIMAGIPAMVFGLLSFALSTVFEHGFVHGFFQGATIALMLIGAYLLGAGLWPRRKEEELREGKQGLPSRDGRGDETC
jgi:hypothetical protein